MKKTNVILVCIVLCLALFSVVYAAPIKLQTPTVTQNGGTYAAAQLVSLSSSEGAAIHYTTNGKTPTTSSNLYTDPILIDQTCTLKARAYKNGCLNSNLMIETYVILPDEAFVSAFPSTGMYAEAQTVTLTLSVTGGEIRYTTDGSAPTIDSKLYEAAILVDKDMTVTAAVFFEGKQLGDALPFYYIIGRQTAAVSASPSTSKTYTQPQKIALKCATDGADIYYTIDGSTPTENSLVYTKPFTLEKATTVKAVAVKQGMLNSDASVFNYNIMENFLLGDVNEDGKITVADALMALKIATEYHNPTERENLVADVDKTGSVTPLDSLYILQHALGTRTTFEDLWRDE